MSFGEAVKTCYSKYATFQGRASRAEFWWFLLYTMLPTFVAYVLMLVAGRSEDNTMNGFGVLLLVLILVWELANLLPYISVLVRRLHDSDRSGWWYWVALVPCIGGIWLLVLLILEGTPGPNRYGTAA
jgi:uncharacterized membrane protein YhaH (DUF805 family)